MRIRSLFAGKKDDKEKKAVITFLSDGKKWHVEYDEKLDIREAHKMLLTAALDLLGGGENGADNREGDADK